jgi:hypothetical protein
MFEAMSGLKINFLKSEVMMVLHDDEKKLMYAEIFGCRLGDWPIKYLGVPVCGSRLRVADMIYLSDKLKKKLEGWAGYSSSIGGRYSLIQSSLSSTLIYHMSMYLLPMTNLVSLTKIIQKFFWEGTGEKQKYHLVKWDLVCTPRKKGGLGIKNLQLFNQCLLCKWWWKLEYEHGLWQTLVKAKYGVNKGITRVGMKFDDSPVWKDLLKVKHLYLKGRMMVVGNGQSTDFWKDAWCGTISFYDRFPQLFDICSQQIITVAEAEELGWQFNYRRWMNPEIQSQWRQMRDSLAMVALNNDTDKPKWKFTKNGIFSVKSLYEKLSAVGVDRSFK